METIETLVLVVHVLAALGITGLVLIQQGKGADMGSGFGAGASSTVFGSGGAGNFLTQATTIIAILFFLTSFGLAYFAKERSKVVLDLGIPQVEESLGEAPDVLELLVPSAETDLPSVEESEIPALDVEGSDIPTSP